MTSATALNLPADAVTAIAAEIRSFGQQGVETGGFLLAPHRSADVAQVAVAGTVGITRRHNLLQISPRALARLFDYADDHELYAPAQFHSHMSAPPFLSHADQTFGLRVNGFISTVIPTFADPPADPAQWGWWTFHGSTWIATPPARVATNRVHIIRFDEHGIEDHTHAE